MMAFILRLGYRRDELSWMFSAFGEVSVIGPLGITMSKACSTDSFMKNESRNDLIGG